ncbi:dolichyl-diphosphooligosaccharide--protein glycosyltransferase subunit 1B [Rutidosis leptorrhynchoides]|uniref:dolichyl-diphosphooligosaccharide--protein glycosyltransferase subunit 1B n=1 Tax=Rutidosis leptorrhynchoides TaxID=125765 RepID=UPI003A9994CB
MEVFEARSRLTLMFALFALLSFSFRSSYSLASPELQILSAERRIDLASHIIRVVLTLKVQNDGASPASDVFLAFPPQQVKHLALIQAAEISGKKRKKSVHLLDVKSSDQVNGPNGAKLYAISLRNPLNTGGSVSIEVSYVLTQLLEPFPVEISQSEPQLVLYRDSASILSPYVIKQQTTVIRTPTTKVESFTRVEPSTQMRTELKYGPYENKPSYSNDPILVHFENNNPFAVVEELVREIEISHWGNLQVTEHYTLVHNGAKHKGGFSRVEYQSRPSISGVSSFKHLVAKLPPRVHSVYYRDNIGNISTSHLRTSYSKSELEIEPRYPLLGGWKATFVIGYGLPLQDVLFESNDGKRYLNFSFGCPIAETVVNKITNKVVLPEGSKNPHVVVPFSVERSAETKYTYLDIVGRPVVVLEKENVVPEHNSPFQVYYDFHPMFMLAEPLMLTSVFFFLFVAALAYLHMDISIRK